MAHSHPRQANILQGVRAAFIVQGTTLAQYCRANDIDPSWAWRALQGKHDGPQANRVRAKLVDGSSFNLDGVAA